MKNIKNLIIVIGFIVFCISSLILALLLIWAFFTDWETVRSFGYIVKMWNTYPLYRISIISGTIGYCCFYFGSKI